MRQRKAGTLQQTDERERVRDKDTLTEDRKRVEVGRRRRRGRRQTVRLTAEKVLGEVKDG